MSVMVLQGPKFTPQKSRPLESGHRRYGVRLAIQYSYKLGQKMNLNFSANMAGFCRDSHKCTRKRTLSHTSAPLNCSYSY